MYVATGEDKDWLLNVQRKLYARNWDSRPVFALLPVESPVRNERRTPGLEEGASESER